MPETDGPQIAGPWPTNISHKIPTSCPVYVHIVAAHLAIVESSTLAALGNTTPLGAKYTVAKQKSTEIVLGRWIPASAAGRLLRHNILRLETAISGTDVLNL